MKVAAIVLLLLLVAGGVVYALLEKRPGYGAYYGPARLTGSRLDTGRVNGAPLPRHTTPNDALACPAAHCPNAKPDAEPKIYPVAPAELLARLKRIALAEPD